MKMIRNTFIFDVSFIPNSSRGICLIINDSNARDTLALTNFWCEMSLIYPNVRDRALETLLMFPSTYLCEQGFPALLLIKNKSRVRLSVEADLRLTFQNGATN